jgi:hypothetical protein
MPTLKTKPDADQIYVCTESYAGNDGLAVAFGERLPGSHPQVQRFPQRFIKDGELLERPDYLRESTANEARHYADLVARHQPTPISTADVFECVQEFSLTDATAEDAKRLGLTQIVVPAGARVHRWSPIATLPQYSDKFEPVAM